MGVEFHAFDSACLLLYMTLHRQVRSINMKKVFVLHKKNLSKSSFSLEMLLIQHLYTTVQGIFQIKLHLTARYLLWMKQIESIVKTKINHLDVMKDFRKEGFIEACFNTRVNWFGGKDSFSALGPFILLASQEILTIYLSHFTVSAHWFFQATYRRHSPFIIWCCYARCTSLIPSMHCMRQATIQ